MEKKFKWLIVDSSGFINGSDIHELAENIVTIPEVIYEIKDKQTRERLTCLPYEIQFRQAEPEDCKVVTQFSRKTGDYASLSGVDLKLIALTYSLDREAHGGNVDHLKTEPKVVVADQRVIIEQGGPVKLPGFFNPKKNKDAEDNNEDHTENDGDTELNNGDDSKQENFDEDDKDSNNRETEDNVDEDDEPDTWITPKNLAEAEEKMKNLLLEEEKCPVACMTSDFAIQNVLIQMGLKVASVKGLMIKQARQFVLRCHACFKTTTRMDKKFCPACGNLGTLRKVSVIVNDKGEKVIQINFKKQISTRGTRYSLPMPKGGKHSNDPILFEDQRLPQNRASKMTYEEKKALNLQTILSDPDYVCRSNPFAMKDVYSRASRFTKQQNVAQHNRRNPNEVGPPTGNRKKSKSKI
ncbi:RNA-binding protein NOB1 [Tetranychus urticae]|uniref:RNA-binding protein NOB1 n=1 Tax=Tetranychus urticae TaxID=32264 RepID=T1L454_TETUR|nr:RNA-binding protein NOB1 [Tetranychus urticae]